MKLDKLGVGIIGASPNGGWGTWGTCPRYKRYQILK